MNQASQPLVSVVIPCYNHEKFVQDCIQSVINQTYQNIELIVIDDGSKDNSVTKIQEMLQSCKDRFFRFELRARPNKGLSATLNEALDWCKGEYYVAIASDDMMINRRIEKQVQILSNNKEYYACSGSQLKIDDNNNIYDEKLQKYIIKNRTVKDRKNLFKRSNNLYSPTTIFRTEVIKAIGGYNSEILIEDLYIFYKAALLNYKHLQVEEIFTYYRMHAENNHKRFIWMHEHKMKLLEELKDYPEYKKIEKLFLLEGFYSISRYVGRNEGFKIFKNCLKYFYHPYFIVGCIFLIIKR